MIDILLVCSAKTIYTNGAVQRSMFEKLRIKRDFREILY